MASMNVADALERLLTAQAADCFNQEAERALEALLKAVSSREEGGESVTSEDLEKAAGAAGALGRRPEEVRLLFHAGRLALTTNQDADAARRVWHSCYTRTRDLGRDEDSAAVARALGTMEHAIEELEAAEEWAEKARRANERAGDQFGEAEDLRFAAMLAGTRGNYDAMVEALGGALKLAEQVGNTAMTVSLLAELGSALAVVQQHQAALKAFQTGAARLGQLEGEVQVAAAQHLSRAMEPLRAATEEQLKAASAPEERALLLWFRGQLAFVDGDREAAIAALEESLKLNRETGNQEGVEACEADLAGLRGAEQE